MEEFPKEGVVWSIDPEIVAFFKTKEHRFEVKDNATGIAWTRHGYNVYTVIEKSSKPVFSREHLLQIIHDLSQLQPDELDTDEYYAGIFGNKSIIFRPGTCELIPHAKLFHLTNHPPAITNIRLATDKEKEWIFKCIKARDYVEENPEWIPRCGEWAVITEGDECQQLFEIDKVEHITNTKYPYYIINIHRKSNPSLLTTRINANRCRKALEKEIDSFIKHRDNQYLFKTVIQLTNQLQWDFATQIFNSSFRKHSSWNEYAERTCIRGNGLQYGSREYWEKEGCIILQFEDWCKMYGHDKALLAFTSSTKNKSIIDKHPLRVVQIKERHQWLIVCKALGYEGYYPHVEYWDANQAETCINLQSENYCRKEWYFDEGYEIISFEEWAREHERKHDTRIAEVMASQDDCSQQIAIAHGVTGEFVGHDAVAYGGFVPVNGPKDWLLSSPPCTSHSVPPPKSQPLEMRSALYTTKKSKAFSTFVEPVKPIQATLYKPKK